MKEKLNEVGVLNSIKIEIGRLVKKALDAGLHDIPYQVYNVAQCKLRKSISKKLIVIENDLVECMRYQEKTYTLLNNLLKKFTDGQGDASEKDVMELILNTDNSLFFLDISLNEKIGVALHSFVKKVSDAKKTFLDIYYIHKIVEFEGYRIGLSIPQNIQKYFLNVVDKYFVTNPSHATSESYYLLKQISDEKNFDKAYYLYYNNLDLLFDFTFIKVNDGKEGTFVPVDLYRPFESVENISENLYSPFHGGKVNFVSGMTTQRIYNISMTQRNIALDVNTVSYIRTMADGQLDKLQSDHIKYLIENINIIKEASSFDYLPYILENYVFSPENEERILKTVNSFEHYFYPNNEEQCSRYYEIVKATFKNEEMIEQTRREYYVGYALLVLICFINFKFSKMKTLQKLEEFCSYMNGMLFLFREPFVEVAFQFFELGNQYRFFKKIQINAKNILKDLKNMAWDVFHLWSLEARCSTEDKGADLLVPYFYCFDKGLLELKECFDLETLFVNKRTKERICFYHKHSYPMEIIEKYKTIEKERERREKFSYENIMIQIGCLENEINSLW
ncbi:MAG: hypothetical protein K2G44_02155 [Clostridia bacterium]|nr:hypothetical protein [Clostridia bacterium]